MTCDFCGGTAIQVIIHGLIINSNEAFLYMGCSRLYPSPLAHAVYKTIITL